MVMSPMVPPSFTWPELNWAIDLNHFARQHAVVQDAAVWLAGAGVVVYAALLLTTVWGDDQPAGRIAFISGVIGGGVALLITHIMGHFWYRPRPYVASHAVKLLIEAARDTSFPSDHLAAAGVVTGILWRMRRKTAYVSLAIAPLFAVSRVMVGAHYPSDTLAGFLAGLLAAAIVTWLEGKWAPYIAPILKDLGKVFVWFDRPFVAALVELIVLVAGFYLFQPRPPHT